MGKSMEFLGGEPIGRLGIFNMNSTSDRRACWPGNKNKLAKASKYNEQYVKEQINKGNKFTHYGGVDTEKQTKPQQGGSSGERHSSRKLLKSQLLQMCLTDSQKMISSRWRMLFMENQEGNRTQARWQLPQ